ncbi:MAG: ATP-dependent helicase HelY, partial [Thermomicrobiales bacterium]|nr:ATP-dependent helicase HelY [Thermomicrobiales bacterium]
TLPDQLVLLRRRLEDLEHVILGEERDNGLYISEGHNATFYGAARAWCLGSTMVEIGEVIELSEGDLVLTFNKTIDLMRQVREMLADVTPHRPLRLTLQEAERLLRRGIVEQSLKLGFAPIEAPATPEAASDEAPAGADHSVLVETPSKPKRRRTAKAATAQAEPEESVASPAKRRKTRVTAMEAEPLEAVASIPAEVANESTPATTRRRRITKKPAAEA